MLRSYIAFDVETTGLNPQENEIIEIGALKVRDGRVAERFMEFIRPSAPLAPAITNLTGITDEMLSGARPRCSVIADFLDFCEDDVLIGHNVIFDYSFMKCSASAENLPFEKSGIDTLKAEDRPESAQGSALQKPGQPVRLLSYRKQVRPPGLSRCPGHSQTVSDAGPSLRGAGSEAL